MLVSLVSRLVRLARENKPVVGFVLVFAISAIYVSRAPDSSVYDAQTLCRNDVQLTRHTIVIIDRTSNFTALQRNDIRRAVKDEIERLEYQEKLSIFSIDANLSSLPEPHDSVCRPARVDSEANEGSTTTFLESEYRDDFVARVDALVDELTQDLYSRRSPILEYLETLTTRRTLEFTSDVPYRRLVIISDLAQHVPDKFSSCEPTPAFKDFQATDYGRRLAPDLTDVEVVIYHVQRDNRCAAERQAEPEHERFWLDYFKEYGAIPLPPSHFHKQLQTGN